MIKLCNTCLIDKTLDEFDKDRTRHDGYSSRIKNTDKIKIKERNKSHIKIIKILEN
jgi:hypothetical protein